MRKYVTKPCAKRRFHDDEWEIYNDLECIARTVHEPEPEPQPTGILDKQGNELFSVEEMEPIGFVRPRS